MSINLFIQNFEESIQGLESGTIQSETVFQELSQWDSLALLTTMAMIDSEYNVSLSASRINGCVTILDLFEVAVKAPS